MIEGIERFIRKVGISDELSESLRILVKAWSKEKEIDSPIIGMNNIQYSFRVFNILDKELKVQSPTLLAAGYGLFQFFYKKKLEGISPIVEGIAEDYLAVIALPTLNIEQQADNYRGMILNVAGDLRAVLISIASNVLDIRHIEYYDINYNNAKTKEALIHINKYVYIPVAHRLGFYKLKQGLEDLVLKLEQPEAYNEIKIKLKESEEEREKIIQDFISPIKESLKEQGLKFKIKGRTKSIHSIYKKIQVQGVSFEKVYDLWAIRIIIDSELKTEKADCWHAFSVVTNLYTPNLPRMRDWISVPRDNGYESLHITVGTNEDRWIEVQIRTERMDDEAENGMAAHWRYKGGKDSFGTDFWLDNIKHALEKNDELLGKEEFRSGKFSTELFAFTPNGDLKKLNIGATILDFAFAVHSQVGLTCVGGIVNGKNVSMKHHLRNGDQVEILTQKTQKPSLDWLNYVTTNRAKLHIRKAFDQEGKLEAEFGKEILLRKLKNWKITYNQDVLEKLKDEFGFKAISDLYRAFYNEKIDHSNVKRFLIKDNEAEVEDELVIEPEIEDLSIDDSSSSDLLVVDNLHNINYNLAKCCNPITGDKIFGFVTVSKGISIHRNNCPNAKDMRERYPYRIIDAVWKEKTERFNFRAELNIRGNDKEGIIGELNNVISKKLSVPILNINLNSNGNEYFGSITVKVYDKEQLTLLIEQLNQLSIVGEVYRKA